MFQLTLVDHLRLTFAHVIHTHRAHTRLALAHGRWNRALQGAEAVTVAGAAATALALVQTGQQHSAIAAAILGTLALLVLVVRLVFNFDTSALTHRTCSAHLWYVREQYRALLADLQDGSLTLDDARHRRDRLMQDLHELYKDAPPADRDAYEAARSPRPGHGDGPSSDAEVDRFLPGPATDNDRSAA